MRTRNMESIFRKLIIEKNRCSHHVKGYFVYEGKKIAQVYYSFGSKEIPKAVYRKIAESMYLTDGQLRQMAKCKISRSQYIEILMEKNLL